MKKIFRFKFLLIIFIVAISFASFAYALNSVSTGYKSSARSTVTVDASGVCKKVINNSSYSYFIPTKTSTEWSSFRSHLPSGVSLGECCISHASKSCYGGDVYWYDSCGNREGRYDDCSSSETCENGVCVAPSVCPELDTGFGCILPETNLREFGRCTFWEESSAGCDETWFYSGGVRYESFYYCELDYDLIHPLESITDTHEKSLEYGLYVTISICNASCVSRVGDRIVKQSATYQAYCGYDGNWGSVDRNHSFNDVDNFDIPDGYQYLRPVSDGIRIIENE